eukprot:GGOE01007139.1.p1 GENE.GGOE01007139.1~~GGOE01007139.1.p1  ORF type:complete len:207 (+),score=61.66 GGOE01007139.1:62-682(+)
MGCRTSKVAVVSQEEVLFFPEQQLPCRNYYANQPCRFGDNCRFAHKPTNLTRLCDQLKAAKTSIDICVFNITCDFITRQIVDAHKRGVHVRIISDDAQAQTKNSDIPELRDAGIPVRTDKSPTHMHHKFCIIDNKVLINGSFNWTVQAVTGNAENVVIHHNPPARLQVRAEALPMAHGWRNACAVHHPAMVAAFAKQFMKLWQEYA